MAVIGTIAACVAIAASVATIATQCMNMANQTSAGASRASGRDVTSAMEKAGHDVDRLIRTQQASKQQAEQAQKANEYRDGVVNPDSSSSTTMRANDTPGGLIST